MGSIAERFTSTGGGQRSSAFQAAIQQGQSELESQLAVQRLQYDLQQQQKAIQAAQLAQMYVARALYYIRLGDMNAARAHIVTAAKLGSPEAQAIARSWGLAF
jgi:hypothetical protein